MTQPQPQPQPQLRLRPFRPEDEGAARAAHAAMATEGFTFLLEYTDGEPWEAYIARREANRHGSELPTGGWWVASTLLAAAVEDELVGRISVRHHLNYWLAEYGGHIGYGVVSGHRRRGYGTEILRPGLVLARAVGIDDVLVLCDVDNIASAATIEACGGVFEAVVTDPTSGRSARRYWIR